MTSSRFLAVVKTASSSCAMWALSWSSRTRGGFPSFEGGQGCWVPGGTATRGVQVLLLVEVKESGRPGAGGEFKKTVTVSPKQDISFRVCSCPDAKNKMLVSAV